MLQRLVFNEKISIIANIAPGKDTDAAILKLNMEKLKDNVMSLTLLLLCSSRRQQPLYIPSSPFQRVAEAVCLWEY